MILYDLGPHTKFRREREVEEKTLKLATRFCLHAQGRPSTSPVLEYESPPEFPDLERLDDVDSNCVVFSTDVLGEDKDKLLLENSFERELHFRLNKGTFVGGGKSEYWSLGLSGTLKNKGNSFKNTIFC